LRTEGAGEPILVGVIARAHGLGGEVVVDSLSDAPDRFAPGSAMTARLSSGATVTLVVEASRPFQRRLLVRFAGIATRSEAEGLRDADLTVERSAVRPHPAGLRYRFELIGLMARTRAGEPLGTVADVFSTGSNDVYVVRGSRGELLLPALPDVILEVDVPGGTMTVAPPAGLPGWDER